MDLRPWQEGRNRIVAAQPGDLLYEIHLLAEAGPLRVHSPLEAVRSFATQTQPTGGTTNGFRDKIRALQQYLRGLLTHLGVLPTHNASNRHCSVTVTD